MTTTLRRDQVATAKTAELLAFYNEQTGQNVVRFADRKTAERRVLSVMDQLEAATAASRRGRVGANRSVAQSASWADPEVRAARCTRTSVVVRKAGSRDTMHFKSVAEAFRQLELPMSKHIKFRMDLKAIGTAEFGDYHFTAQQ